jgi:uncharacterized surface protein with fasciclin (FAS1) repeats
MKYFLSCAALAAGLTLTATGAHASGINFSRYFACSHAKLTVFNGTIVDAAVATPELSTLVSLVTSAKLVDALSAPGQLTVFAPTNSAFGKVPAPLLNLIGGDPALLTKVLTYHVVAKRVDPRRLFPAQVATLQGQKVFVGYDIDSVSVNQSTASCTGIKTNNGTVWLIDSVLLPQFK